MLHTAEPFERVRYECPLSKLFFTGKLTQAEYNAGVRWRGIYLGYLQSIGAPQPYGSSDGEIDMSDEDCEKYKSAHQAGCEILNSMGRRVFHAVNAVAVFEESEELGDFEFTAKAAKKGLTVLARSFA